MPQVAQQRAVRKKDQNLLFVERAILAEASSLFLLAARLCSPCPVLPADPPCLFGS